MDLLAASDGGDKEDLGEGGDKEDKEAEETRSRGAILVTSHQPLVTDN
ncbi:hypothetical protein [Chroococcidiopsis sp.]